MPFFSLSVLCWKSATFNLWRNDIQWKIVCRLFYYCYLHDLCRLAILYVCAFVPGSQFMGTVLDARQRYGALSGYYPQRFFLGLKFIYYQMRWLSMSSKSKSKSILTSQNPLQSIEWWVKLFLAKVDRTCSHIYTHTQNTIHSSICGLFRNQRKTMCFWLPIDLGIMSNGSNERTIID